jgi:two-component system response regulator YesN
MRIARQRYPKLLFVVLTFHQELEYAQEAIRLGAIDYIAKVQLEKEGFDEVLGRIRDRFLEEREKSDSAQADGEALEWFASDVAYALLSIRESPDAAWIRACLGISDRGLVEIGDGAWLWAPRDEQGIEPGLSALRQAAGKADGWTIVELRGLGAESRNRVHGLIRKYRQKDLFYEYDSRSISAIKNLPELDPPLSAIEDDAMERASSAWLACEWVYDDALFGRLRGELRAARPPVNKLLRLLVELEGEWNRIFWPIASRRIKAPEVFASWQEVELWLTEMRESAFAGNKRLSYAGDVVNSMMRALRIVDEEMGGPLFAVDVARRVNMSRGYFCRCFKDIIGKPFNDFLRGARVEKAKLLLHHTDAQMYQIAEQVGYTDEKYFSHVFREQAGLLPSEFRQISREGRR